MSEGGTDNPDRVFISAIMAKGHAGEAGIPIDTNAFFRSLGTRLLGGTPGNVTLGFTIGEDAIQGNGVVGGGALAAMLDCAAATATLSALAPATTCSTISLTVNMLGPSAVGEFRAEASVEKLGRRVAFVAAKLFDAKDRLVATASSALAVVAL
ncbi:MAG: PaaI family thioesterase [Novosphingobium sp.]